MSLTTLTVHVDFAPALRAIPNLGRKKTPCDPRICGKAKGPLYGRNEHIGHFIARQTGVRRSRKQISSHIQVLKYFQKGNAECTISTIYLNRMKANLPGMALITKSDPSVLESQPLDVYPPDPIQGPSSSIDSSDPETSVRDYVEVAFPTTPVTNFFLLPSSSCDSYDLSFSESTSYRSSISNSQLSAGCISYRSSYSESFESCSQGCFFQEQRENCCSHGDYCSAAANRYSRHGPGPTEYKNFGTASYADPDFEIPVHESNSLNVPSFPFIQESYSTSYTTSCAARNNLPAHMAAPPRTRLSAAHNHNTKSQIPFHHFHDPFSKAEHQNWHTQSVEDPLDNEEWQSIEQVAPEQTWANHHPDVDEANIPAKQGQVLGEIIDVPATKTDNKTLKRELGLQS